MPLNDQQKIEMSWDENVMKDYDEHVQDRINIYIKEMRTLFDQCKQLDFILELKKAIQNGFCGFYMCSWTKNHHIACQRFLSHWMYNLHQHIAQQLKPKMISIHIYCNKNRLCFRINDDLKLGLSVLSKHMFYERSELFLKKI